MRDVPRPAPADGEVLVRVSAVGVCGTDFHIVSGESNYNFDDRGDPIPLRDVPQVLGHEITGVVEQLGAGAGGLREGDRVVVDQGLNCASVARTPWCEYCATGDTHQCAFYREYGITGLPGGFAEYLAVPAVNCVAVRSDVAPEVAALTEPLGCILHSSDRAARANGRYAFGARDPGRRIRTVVILGAGPAGLFFLQYLRRVAGFEGRILVSEPNAVKRALAAELGADVVDPAADDALEAVLELSDGRRAEYLVEATGSGRVYAEIPGLIRKQATVLAYGIGHGGASLELMNQVQWKEPAFVISIGASGPLDEAGRPTVYARALRLLEDGSIDAARMISHRYAGLEDVPRALGGEHRAPDYVKGVVVLQ